MIKIVPRLGRHSLTAK